MVMFLRRGREIMVAALPALTIVLVLLAIGLASGWIHFGGGRDRQEHRLKAAAEAKPVKLTPRFPEAARSTTLRLRPTIGLNDGTEPDNDTYSAKTGDYLRLHVVLENPTEDDVRAIAQTTRLTVSVPREAARQHTVTIRAEADNAPPVSASAVIRAADGEASILSAPYAPSVRRNHPQGESYYRWGSYQSPGSGTVRYDYASRTAAITYMPAPNGNLSNAYGKELEFSMIIKVGGSDPVGRPALKVALQARRFGDTMWRSTLDATVGDLLEYQIKATNTGNARSNDTYLTVYTNLGVMYVPGSARIDGPNGLIKVSDELAGSGLYLDALPADDTRIYRFTAKVLDRRPKVNQGPGVQLSADRTKGSFVQPLLRVYPPSP